MKSLKLSEDPTDASLVAFKHKGQENIEFTRLEFWRDLLRELLGYLKDEQPSNFKETVVSEENRPDEIDSYFSEDPKSLTDCEEVQDGTYVELNLSADDITDFARDLIYSFGLDPENSEIMVEVESKTKNVNRERKNIKLVILSNFNLVFQGPPGTGKTYEALQFAASQVNEHLDDDEEKLTEDSWRDELEDYQFSTLEDEISELDDEVEQKEKWREQPVVWEIVQLHPEYAYEDFVRGMATQGGEGIEFAPEDQTFVKMAELARLRQEAADDGETKPTILILDEINRANLPSLLGELIYALEADKRGDKIRLQYEAPDENDEEWLDSDDALEVPENLWVLGTMNTADRSIAMVDYAIRRRFRFMEMQPDPEVFEDYYDDERRAQVAKKILVNINENMIADDVEDRLGVGHSYLMVDPDELHDDTKWQEALRDQLQYEVGPLLKEYGLEGHLQESWEWQDEWVEAFGADDESAPNSTAEAFADVMLKRIDPGDPSEND